jgi:uncharacterized protein (TIGR04255 family)
MTNTPELTTPPIIEAVLDIECDFVEQPEIKKIEARARKEMARSYPKVRHVLFQEHQVEAKPSEPAKISIKGGLHGLQFLKNDEKQVVQFRIEGFSFNRLAPYTSLDNYLPQMKKNWAIYRDLTNPLQIRLIRLRYINRILLPLINGKVDLDEYILNGPRLADPNRFDLTGFIDQYAATDRDTGNQINSVLTLQQVVDNKLPVIFDNGVVTFEGGNVDDWQWIRSKILELRELKNYIFCHTLTEKCLNLFQ